jgi:hypothetical protein
VKGLKDPVTVPAFSFSPNEGLAQLIVEAWTNDEFREGLLKRNGTQPTVGAVTLATAAVNASGGFDLSRAVIITEEEHDKNYTSEDDDEVVFVLPNPDRVRKTGNLLNTARLLMACTPNGI